MDANGTKALHGLALLLSLCSGVACVIAAARGENAAAAGFLLLPCLGWACFNLGRAVERMTGERRRTP